MKNTKMINGLQKCGKRQRTSYSKSTMKKKVKEDYTERLPDEIIASCILSRLPLKAAMRTSVLSSRWRNMWKNSIGTRLFFSDDDLYLFDKDTVQDIRSNLQFVNYILKSYPHSTMDDFNLRLPLSQKHSSVIDGWLQFAFTKGIKRIKLHPLPFSIKEEHRPDHPEIYSKYVFPDVKKLSKWLLLENNSNLNMIPVGSTRYDNRLTELELRNVEINQGSISFILSSCPFLECLSICRVKSLQDLKVVGNGTSHLRLRSLEIVGCNRLLSIEISAPNLTLFKFHGPGLFKKEFTMWLKHVPRLSEMYIAGGHTSNVIQSFPQHYSYISLLEKLTLQLSAWDLKESISNFPLEFPKLNKLKHLEVFIHVFSLSHCLLWPTSLIKAAPLLQTFTAKLRYREDRYRQDELFEVPHVGPEYESLVTSKEDRRRMQEATYHVHESLKVVELIGFYGSTGSDWELARHLLSVAKSLVKVVFDTSLTQYHPERYYPRLFTKAAAGKLREMLPVGAELVII